MTNPTPPNQPSAEAGNFSCAVALAIGGKWDQSKLKRIAELFDAHTQALRERVAYMEGLAQAVSEENQKLRAEVSAIK